MVEINGAEVAKHNIKDSCWIVLHGKVWNVTDFVDAHPGGAAVILKRAGQDGTEAYDEVHNPELVGEMLPATACLGKLQEGSLPKLSSPSSSTSSPPSVKPTGGQGDDGDSSKPKFPPLEAMVNVMDFERVAKSFLTPTGWAYYSSGAEDEISLDDTRRIFNRITLRPRILRDVIDINTSTPILGATSSLPFYISPTGLGRYAHRDAEKILATVAANEGISYQTPTASSTSQEDVYGAYDKASPSPNAPKVLQQLYFNIDKKKAEDFVRKVERLGAGGLFVTVDSPVLGRRERDDRLKVELGLLAPGAAAPPVTKATMTAILNPCLTWKDIKWLQSITKMPIILKGVSSVEDALMAREHGLRGVVLSNHGGRSLDTSQAPILTLLEIRKHAPHLISAKDFEIYVDGGIRRGTDIIKLMALGATAVGIGRPFLYAMTAEYGADGVRRMIQMIKNELEVGMAMIGATSISELTPEMINSERVEHEVSRRIKL